MDHWRWVTEDEDDDSSIMRSMGEINDNTGAWQAYRILLYYNIRPLKDI